MIHPSDTPPNGDFAAYVERLTGTKAVPAPREDLFRPTGGVAGGSSFSASSGLPSASAASAGAAPAIRSAFLGHVKWVVGLWLAARLLGRYSPGAVDLFIPALVLYVVWVVFNIRRRAPAGGWVEKLNALARQATEEARKAQALKPKIKP